MAKKRTTKKKKTSNLLTNVNNIHIKIGAKRRGASRPAQAQQPRGLYPSSNNVITTVPQPHYQGTNVMELQQLINEVREGNRVRAHPVQAHPVQANPVQAQDVQAHAIEVAQPLETFYENPLRAQIKAEKKPHILESDNENSDHSLLLRPLVKKKHEKKVDDFFDSPHQAEAKEEKEDRVSVRDRIEQYGGGRQSQRTIGYCQDFLLNEYQHDWDRLRRDFPQLITKKDSFKKVPKEVLNRAIRETYKDFA